MPLDLNSRELPRERLISAGPEALKDEELLAILFGTGMKGCNVIDMSRALLKKYGSLKSLARAGVAELTGQGREDGGVKGIGTAKAVILKAALELGRRSAREEERPDDLRSRLLRWGRELDACDREFIVALYLDRKSCPIDDERLSYGGPDGAALDVPYLLRRAVRLDCASLVLMHNHPDGDLRPSDEDRILSEAVARRLRLLNIDFYGHYIAGGGAVRRIPGDGSSGDDVMADSPKPCQRQGRNA